MALWQDWVRRGTTVAKPAAAADNEGMLYYDTDLERLERSNGAAWEVCDAIDVSAYLDFDEQGGAPADPGANVARVYALDDGAGNTRLYYRDSVPNVYLIGVINGIREGVIGFTIDGGGAVIAAGLKGFVEVPAAGNIVGWTIVADQAGSIVVDVWLDTYANFPPTILDTIAGAEKPTLAAAQKNQDLALGTWTTAVAKGDWLAFNVEAGPAGVTWVAVTLRVEYTL